MTAERLWVSAEGAGDLWLVRDDEGRPAALVDRALHTAIDPGDGTSREPRWHSYAVVWSRSGTLYPGDMRSNDLEATCREVLDWESTPVRGELLDDHLKAAERLRLAAVEFAGLDARVRSELTARPRLPRQARPLRRGRGAGRGRSIDRSAVLEACVERLNVEGVRLTPRAGIIDQVAARLSVRREVVTALWPSESALQADMLLALARDGLRRRADDDTLIATWHFLARESPRLRSALGRRSVLRDLIAFVAAHNFDRGTSSTSWRNYVACVASVAEDDALSERLTSELRASEEDFLAQLSGFYENVISLIGFRLAPTLRGEPRAFAVALSAVVEGLGIARHSVPTVIETPLGEDVDKPIAEVLLGVLLAGLLEEDPDYDPDTAIDRLTHGLVDAPVRQ